MAAHGARRLLAMADNTRAIIAIELLTAAQGCDFHRPLESSAPLETARAALRAVVPPLEEDRHLHPDLAAAIALVRDGAILPSTAELLLPGVCGAP